MKKTIKKIIATILTAAMAMSVGMPAFAAEVYEKNNQNMMKIIAYDFSNMTLTSEANQNNIDVLENDITEIRCNVEINGQELTVGYRDDNGGISYEELLNALENEINYINGDLLNDGKLGSYAAVTFNDLTVDTIEIMTAVQPSTKSVSIDLEGDYTEKSVVIDLNSFSNTREIKKSLISDTEEEIFSLTASPSSHHYYSSGNIMHYNSQNGTRTQCPSSPTNPHGGDGNTRRAEGLNWHPNYVEARFNSNVSAGKNKSTLYFKFSQTNLNNLNIDNNEALEMTLMLYNEPNSTSYPGSAYQTLSGRSYISNLPDNYLDTSFGDSSTILQQCIGCADTSSLMADATYFWSITSNAGTNNGKNYDGAFRVVAQRSYDFQNGLTTPYRIFAEEHEPQLKFGLGAGQRWFSGTQNAWNLANNGIYWIFNNGTISNEGA